MPPKRHHRHLPLSCDTSRVGGVTRQNAAELHLSVETVETYQAHIKEKLSLKNGHELVHHAVRWASHQG